MCPDPAVDKAMRETMFMTLATDLLAFRDTDGSASELASTILQSIDQIVEAKLREGKDGRH